MNRAEKRRQQKLAKKATSQAKRGNATNRFPGKQMPVIQASIERAVQHHTAGELAKAEGIYQQILLAEPNHPIALHLLGVIAHQVGKNNIAVDLIKKALVLKPDYVEAHDNLGNTLKELNKLDEAVTSYHNALALKPDYADGHYNLANTLKELNKLDEAVASYHRALAIKPDYPKAHNNLANTLGELNRLDEAVASYHKALAIKPDYADAHNNLGSVLLRLGKQDEAFKYHRRAVALNPQNDLYWSGLALSLETLSFTSVDDGLDQDLLHLLERPTTNPSHVVQSVISALWLQPNFSQIFELAGSGNPGISIVYGDAAEQLSAIPLFLQIMELSPLSDLKIERMLTFLRHEMLQETMAGKADEKSLSFPAALALQCFVNEYVFPETDEEKGAIDRLQQQIATRVQSNQDVPPSFITALGTYRPLYKFPWARKLSTHKYPGNIKKVIERQISEPLIEQSLRPQIPCLTPVQDTISQSVREQYEENPYPRWIRIGVSVKSRPIKAVLQGAPIYLDIEEYVSPEEPKILIAGCGTGQHALRTAPRFSNAHVLAVDLSLSSLSYALRKTNELGLSNIEYAQADIMELGNLGRRFDLIESAGVLHHLGDPLAGWRILVDLLNPGGLMKIGLYSETARQNVVSGRALISQMGYSTSPEDMRKCRQDIIEMAEDGNLEMIELCHKRDFFSLSECRDLLFHVQEHRFTLPQIDAALKALNLKFLGFEMRNQSTLRRFNAAFPEKSALTSLSQWHKFELKNPDTFSGMYQFWCKKL